MPWEIKKSSFVGTSHEEQGKVCQDYANYYLVPDDNWVIGAVADGAGSAKHSEIGAKIAVEEAINYIKNKLHSKLINNEDEARQNFTVVLDVVLDKLKEEAKNKGFLLSDLNSTLLVFIATNNWFAAMQIGDGMIVIKPKDGDYKLVFKPDKGEYANQTTFITSSNAKSQMQFCFKSINLSFICLATDWCENISVTKTKGDWKAKQDFFKLLENCLLKNKNNIYQDLYQDCTPKTIDEILNWEKIKQNIDDDRTLLVCVYEETGTLTSPLHKEVIVLPDIKPQEAIDNSKNPDIKNKNVIKETYKEDDLQTAKTPEEEAMEQCSMGPFHTASSLNCCFAFINLVFFSPI